jgi:DNA-binding transcriptional LysR family regulator
MKSCALAWTRCTRKTARLGVRLMNRTTRRLSMTDEGHAFLAHCRETLGLIHDAEQEIQNKHNGPTGLIRINAPLTH